MWLSHIEERQRSGMDVVGKRHDGVWDAEHYLGVIEQFAPVLGEERSLESLLWTLCRRAIEPLGFSDCVVYLLDPTSRRLVQRAAVGPKNPSAEEILDPIEIPLGSGIVGSVAQSGDAEIIVDTRDDSRYILDDAFRLSEIAVPIIDRGRVIGVLDSEHPERDHYRPYHLRALTTLASMIASKVARLIADTHHVPMNSGRYAEDGPFHSGTLDLLVGNPDLLLGSQDEILSVLSHELRTPLNGILSLVSVLIEEKATKTIENHDNLKIVERSGIRLLHVVDALLNLPSVLREPSNLMALDIDLALLIEQVVRETQTRYPGSSVDIILDLPPGMKPLRTDPDRMSQILIHLIENAIKFTPGGEVTIAVEPDSATGTPSRICVTDTGVGIESEEHKNILVPFYQVDSGVTRRYEGLGLGLTLVDGLCRWMGHRMELQSEPGVGSQFSIHLGRAA